MKSLMNFHIRRKNEQTKAGPAGFNGSAGTSETPVQSTFFQRRRPS
ncbi:hypothetical protein [Paraburkholderia fynbosensis]|nr:hypothetical protein [Paraburkholderia fynbosensis]